MVEGIKVSETVYVVLRTHGDKPINRSTATELVAMDKRGYALEGQAHLMACKLLDDALAYSNDDGACLARGHLKKAGVMVEFYDLNYPAGSC